MLLSDILKDILKENCCNNRLEDILLGFVLLNVLILNLSITVLKGGKKFEY